MFECNVCGQDGERYTITFPDGQLTLDRCSRHDKQIIKLREDKKDHDSWVTKAPGGRTTFKVTSESEIKKQIKE